MTKLRAGAAATLDAVTRRPAVVALAAAACAAIAALAVSAPGAAAGAVAPAMVTASHGRLELSGDRGTGYLELHNATARQVVVQAAVSPVAASVVWATRQQVITPAHLYTASGLCEDVPALESEANAAAHALHDLVIDPGATLTLRAGSGALEFTGLTPGLRHGTRVPVTLYLDDGQRLTSELTVS